MKTYNNLYGKIISFENLVLAWEKARKGKTKKNYVIEFEKNLNENLLDLHYELKNKIYIPKSLETFVLRDPKTRVISKSHFRDRIVHHAICNVIDPIFDKTFIYDSCANRIGKGNLFALERFKLYKRKITKNLRKEAYCLKADIKHYFQEVNHEILIRILERKISDVDVVCLIKHILRNNSNTLFTDNLIGMPIGNLTSQFFANVYLNELDYFVKHRLKAKYYIRYVDDFVTLHESQKQLEEWKGQIDEFLRNKLKLELHPDKSRIIALSKGIDFVGFRNYYHFRLPRKRNINKMKNKIKEFEKGEIEYDNLMISFQGWQAYVKWSNSYNIRKDILKEIARIKYKKIEVAKNKWD
ncbi:MAG: reverse transcriptase domain-containing protein [Nanoarchaeota archaeon]